MYNPETESWDEYHDLITDQSIIALVADDGVIYGGTSVFGGNGIEPSQEAGVVFAFDLDSRELLWTTPIDGLAVTAVAVAGGEIWAATVGDLLILDPSNGEIVDKHEVEPVDWGDYPNGLWSSADLAFSEADGLVYGAVSDHILRIDPGTRQVEQLDGASGRDLVHSEGNTSYWLSGGSLHSASWPLPDPASLVVQLTATLHGYVDSEDVAGPIVDRLSDTLERAYSHLDGGRTTSATKALDRFIRHVDSPNQSDTLSRAAHAALRSMAQQTLVIIR